MIFTIRITDNDAIVLHALLEAGMEVVSSAGGELGADAELALDRFAVQTGKSPIWHKENDETLRPRGE